MADPTKTVGGMYGRLYAIQESEPNVTPDNDAWPIRVMPLKDFSPTFNRNRVPLTSAGSKRLVGHTAGGPFDVGASFSTQAWGDIWLEYLEMMLGYPTGTGLPCEDGDRLKTYSLLGFICRERGAVDEFERAILYNGWKVATATISKTVGPDPISLAMTGQCQYAQVDDGTWPSDLPRFIGFQGTGGDPLTIASLPAPPAASLKPVHYYNFSEQIKYGANPAAPLPRLASWEFSVNQGLKPVPDIVLGADGERYPIHAGFADESMEIAFRMTVTPEDLAYYEEAAYSDEPITYLDLIYTAPPGYSVPAKTLRLHNGVWEVGDWSIKELVSMDQALNARFERVEII